VGIARDVKRGKIGERIGTALQRDDTPANQAADRTHDLHVEKVWSVDIGVGKQSLFDPRARFEPQ